MTEDKLHKTKPVPGKFLIYDRELFYRFKAIVSRRGESMTDAIEALLRDFVEREERRDRGEMR